MRLPQNSAFKLLGLFALSIAGAVSLALLGALQRQGAAVAIVTTDASAALADAAQAGGLLLRVAGPHLVVVAPSAPDFSARMRALGYLAQFGVDDLGCARPSSLPDKDKV